MQIAKFLALAKSSEEVLSDSFMHAANRHEKNAEVRDMSKQFALWSKNHITALAPLIDRFGTEATDEPLRVRSALFHGTRVGGLGLLRDLQDLSLLAKQAELNWTSIEQAAKGLHDVQFESVCAECKMETQRQLAWLATQIQQTATQALTVNPDKAASIKASLPKTPTPSAMPEILWSPVAAGSLMIFVGVIAWLTGKPWLIPSLGPTAFLQAETPAHPSSRFYNTTVGHLVGLGMGFAAVTMFHASELPGVLTDHHLVLTRVWASAVALALTLLICLLLKASHPPAAATTLLVALGAIKTRQDALNVVAGVVLIAIFGEIARRLRLKTAVARPD